MKTIKALVTLLILFLLHGPVLADGSRLLRSCEVLLDWPSEPVKGERYEAGFCLGYISGVYDLNASYQKDLKVPNPYFCAPDRGVTNGQNARILINYLEEHPETLRKGNLNLTLAAFIDAFPCEK